MVALTPYQLRFCPASYLHEDHFPDLWRWLPQSMPEWRNLPASNQALLDELTLGIDYGLPSPLGGLALFPAELLRSLLRQLGAVLHGEAIRHSLQAGVLRQVIALLGEEGHRSLLAGLDLLIGPWPAGWQLSLPERFDEAALQMAGLGFWLAATGDADPDWARRLILRLPASPLLRRWRVSDELRPLAQGLCLKLAKQVTPECCHLLK